MRLGDGFDATHHLPLRDLVDEVDVIDALDSIQVSLMHRIDPQVARLAVGPGLAPLSDGYLYGPRFGVIDLALAIARALAEVVNMRHRDPRQPLVLGTLELLELAFQNLSRRRTRQGLVRFIGLGQQLDIGARVAARKTVAAVAGYFHFAVLHVAGHQERDPGPAPPRHLLQVALQRSPHPPALLAVLLHPQRPRDPLINLYQPLCLKPVLLAAFQKCLDLLLT